jgi:hypothetical protein
VLGLPGKQSYVAEKTFGETLESLTLKRYLEMLSYSTVKTKLNFFSDQVIFILFSCLITVEHVVVLPQNVTGLECRTLTSRLCSYIRCISVNRLMPPGRISVRAVFLHYHAKIGIVVQPVSSQISNRCSFPGEAVDWFLTSYSLKLWMSGTLP